jgi:hypothetical protein
MEYFLERAKCSTYHHAKHSTGVFNQNDRVLGQSKKMLFFTEQNKNL